MLRLREVFRLSTWRIGGFLFSGKTTDSPPAISSGAVATCLSYGPHLRWWSWYFPRHWPVETSCWDPSPPRLPV